MSLKKVVNDTFWVLSCAPSVERNPFDTVDTSNALFQILVEWVTILVWLLSVSRHHLLYSSIPQKVPQHYLLGMVQHFMIHAMKQQFFCFSNNSFVSPVQNGGAKDLIISGFVSWRYQHCISLRALACWVKYLSLYTSVIRDIIYDIFIWL